jgi:hypothetical protein
VKNVDIIHDKVMKYLLENRYFKKTYTGRKLHHSNEDDYYIYEIKNYNYRYDNIGYIYQDGQINIVFYTQSVVITPFIRLDLTNDKYHIYDYSEMKPVLTYHIYHTKQTYIHNPQKHNIDTFEVYVLYNEENFNVINKGIFRDRIIPMIELNEHIHCYLANSLYVYYESYKIKCIDRLDLSVLFK